MTLALFGGVATFFCETLACLAGELANANFPRYLLDVIHNLVKDSMLFATFYLYG